MGGHAVQDQLQLPQNAPPLVPTALGVDKHKQGGLGRRNSDLIGGMGRVTFGFGRLDLQKLSN